jgi:hypothetical protein
VTATTFNFSIVTDTTPFVSAAARVSDVSEYSPSTKVVTVILAPSPFQSSNSTNSSTSGENVKAIFPPSTKSTSSGDPIGAVS